MKVHASIFLLLLMAAPAALANSVSIQSDQSNLNDQSKSPFINYQIPSGGTAILQQVLGPAGNVRWELSGQATDGVYTFTFDFDHTQSPYDFYDYSPLSFVGNGVSYRGTIIHAHIDPATGLMSGGWTGGSGHGRFTLQLYYNGSGCSTNPSAECLNLGAGTFSVATTPEPASLLLMTTGLLAITLKMRRKLSRTL